jgi:hypothetical protein
VFRKSELTTGGAGVYTLALVPTRRVVAPTPRRGTLPTIENVPATVSKDKAPQLAPEPVAQARVPSTL